MSNKPSVQRLRELFSVSESGELIRRMDAGPSKRGAVAGWMSVKGYVHVSVDNTTQHAHRVVFAVVHGRWPVLDIDHIDGNGRNNSPANLREVTRTVNIQNQRKASAGNSSGLMGASRCKGKYRAVIVVDGRPKCVGTFRTPDEAHVAYVRAKRIFHPGCTI